MKVPVLETERLILREYRLADFPAHDSCWADPRTTRFFNDFTYDREMVWLRFQRNWGQWAMFGHGWWALEAKDSGAYAGSVGLFEARREMELPYRDLPEAGWFIAPDRHGQGLASEALTAALAWADARIEAPESWCMIAPQNVISQKTAAKMGYARADDAQYRGQPVFTYRRPRGAP
jgi:RimJ/RimL family protein N-acetyltransferase